MRPHTSDSVPVSGGWGVAAARAATPGSGARTGWEGGAGAAIGRSSRIATRTPSRAGALQMAEATETGERLPVEPSRFLTVHQERPAQRAEDRGRRDRIARELGDAVGAGGAPRRRHARHRAAHR